MAEALHLVLGLERQLAETKLVLWLVGLLQGGAIQSEHHVGVEVLCLDLVVALTGKLLLIHLKGIL